MKNLILVFCALVVMSHAFAQPPAGAPDGAPAGMPGGAPTGASRGGREAMNSGHFYGKLVDSGGKAIGNASVLILKVFNDTTAGKKKEVLLKDIASQKNGNFSAEDLPIGSPLKLRISAVGYPAISREILLTPQVTDKDLGDLKLAPAAKELQQVIVTASKPAMTVDMVRRSLMYPRIL